MFKSASDILLSAAIYRSYLTSLSKIDMEVRVSAAISWINLYLWSRCSLSWQSLQVSLSHVWQNKDNCSWEWIVQNKYPGIFLFPLLTLSLSFAISSLGLIMWSLVIFSLWWALKQFHPIWWINISLRLVKNSFFNLRSMYGWYIYCLCLIYNL